MLKKVVKSIKIIAPGLFSLAGPFIIAYSWYYYHLTSEQKAENFWQPVATLAIAVFILFFLFKLLFRFLVNKFKWHTFWLTEFTSYLDELFFWGATAFFVLFFKNELWSLVYILTIFAFIFWRLDNILSRHKEDLSWRKVNRAVFLLAGCLFVMLSFFQYTAYHYFIFDSNAKYANIVLFRVFSLTLLWLGSFAFGSLVYFYFKKVKQLFLFFWLVCLWAVFFLNMVNAGVAYEAGLYLSPIIFSHFSRAGLQLYWLPVILGLSVYFALLFLTYLVFRRVLRAHEETTSRHWLFYNFALICAAIFSVFAVNSLRNTPEVLMFRNFYDTYRQVKMDNFLTKNLEEKLEKFGLFYDQNKFAVLDADKQSETKNIGWSLSDGKRPNILIVYLESFSARLTGPYNKQYEEVTPGLNIFAADKNTTIFRKVYNASTPTITALLSSFCSFLPPTGHEEIERDKELKSHHLTCLPAILKKNGYKNISFITAVDKEFSNKNTILESMGINKIWGSKELKKEITEEPKSWGYSDHQLFPFLFEKISEEESPFVMIYETVDTHPPFNLPKDMVYYKDGHNPVLNALHTTDNAFATFWQQFKNSSLAENTMVIVIADHAIFPVALEQKYFADLYGKTTFYDELFFGLYLPQNNISKEIEVYGSGIDMAPTILHLLNIEAPKKFEGWSLLGERSKYPNLIGMHEFGLYLNQTPDNKTREESFSTPNDVSCDLPADNEIMSLCELKTYYDWKRDMLLSGRLW